jgi:hypothetical protein
MKIGILNGVRQTLKGQAMSEFLMMAVVAFIILFVAVQLAALGREAMALGELNYQVTRWATAPGNETADCTAVKNFIQSPGKADYSAGYMGKIIFDGGLACTGDKTPKPDGITVSMTVTCPPASPGCPATRPAGTPVQISMTMGTRYALFLSSSSTPSFLGIPFPTTLSSSQTMLTQ